MTETTSRNPPGNRYPHWISWNYFIGTQLTPVVTAVCAVWFVAGQLRRARADVATSTGDLGVYRLLIPFVAFAFNAAFYYQAVWSYYYGFWMLALSVGCTVKSTSGWTRAVLAISFLPCAYIALRPASIFGFLPPDSVAITTPIGERLYLPPELASQTEHMVAALHAFEADPARTSGTKGFLVLDRKQPMTVTSHLHYFYGLPQVMRLTMNFPGRLRPRDLRQIEQAMRTISGVVLLQDPKQGRPPQDICQWDVYAFPEEFCRRISPMLGDPIPVDGASWIFPVTADPAARAPASAHSGTPELPFHEQPEGLPGRSPA